MIIASLSMATGEPNSCSIYSAFNMDGNSPMGSSISGRGDMPEYSPMVPMMGGMPPPMMMPGSPMMADFPQSPMMGPPPMMPMMGGMPQPPHMQRMPPPPPRPARPSPSPPSPRHQQNTLVHFADKYGHLFSVTIVLIVAGVAFSMLE